MASKTDTMWRVEYRKDRKSAWKKRSGLFETRAVARWWQKGERAIYGFGNTRIRRHVRGGGR